MRRRSLHRAGYVAGLWMFSMAAQFLTDAYAAGPDGKQADRTGILRVRTVLLASAGQEDGSLNEITLSKPGNPDSVATKPGIAKSSRLNMPLAHRAKPNSRSKGSVSPISSAAAAHTASGPSHKLALRFSMTLSDPAQPIQPVSPVSTNVAAEVESPAKEKKLRELYAQIAATEKLIEARQRQLALMESPSDPGFEGAGLTSTKSGDSNSAEVVKQQSKPKAATQGVQSASDDLLRQVRSLEILRVDPAIGLVVMSFSVLAVFGYRKIKSMYHGQAEAPDIHEDGRYPRLSVINQAAASRIEQTMKSPAYVEQKTQPILPPEYEMLEEADIYLRFGHDKLAEEALREAIKINPRNPQAYLTLLRICFSRKDSAAFLALARQLQPLSDEYIWAKAAEMGRDLEPANTLYT